MKNQGTPAQNSNPMKATYSRASMNMVNIIRKVNSRSLP
jgi:hypothetical protein